MQLINSFLTNLMTFVMDKTEREEGQTLVEYALIIALISLLVVALALILKDPLTTTFQKIANGLNSAS